MRRFIALLILICLKVNLSLNAHPWKPDRYVVIDTDCGLDDFRAINLMLASPNVRVLAIITSNGVVNAEDGFVKVKSLLKDNYQEGILVGLNPDANQKAHNCKVAMEYSWTDEHVDANTKPVSYKDILNQVFENCTEKITFINIGGLNTVDSYFNEYPEQIKNVKEFLWTCNCDNYQHSFNYLLDTSSFNSTINMGFEISYVNGASFGNYSDELVYEISMYDSQMAKGLYNSLSIPNSSFAKMMYDESVLFYILNKQIFTVDSIKKDICNRLNPKQNITYSYIDFLSGNSKNQNQVLACFSTDTSDYISDIQLMMKSTINNYGKEEWDACVLTSELHRHLGIYSLIGSKMGIRGREYFGAGVDELRIVSFAGLNPPFSCLNDGLQVSTGATLGHGLISVNENTKLPKAEFYYMGQKITISLKEEYQNKIEMEIKELRMINGLDGNIYWDLLRNLALQYWEHWDRHTIFEIEVN